jgi:hypothetical protein
MLFFGEHATSDPMSQVFVLRIKDRALPSRSAPSPTDQAPRIERVPTALWTIVSEAALRPVCTTICAALISHHLWPLSISWHKPDCNSSKISLTSPDPLLSSTPMRMASWFFNQQSRSQLAYFEPDLRRSCWAL